MDRAKGSKANYVIHSLYLRSSYIKIGYTMDVAYNLKQITIMKEFHLVIKPITIMVEVVIMLV